MSGLPSATAAALQSVSGDRYLPLVMAAVTRARTSVRVLQYILDTRPDADPTHSVGHLLRCLSLAAARGVDVSVLLHDYESPAAGAGNLPGALFLTRRGASVRLFHPRSDEQRRVLHTKAVVVDGKYSVVGTQNWSPGAFLSNDEAGVGVESCAFAQQLSIFFDGMWARSKEPHQ